MMRSQCLNYICLSLFLRLTEASRNQAESENPYTNPKYCNLKSSGYICDPVETLSMDGRIQINSQLMEYNRDNKCGHCFVVLTSRKLMSKDSFRDILAKIADGKLGHKWVIPGCDSFTVIGFNPIARIVPVETGVGGILCDFNAELFPRHRKKFAEGHYTRAIVEMIKDMREKYLSIYKTGIMKCDVKTCGPNSDYRLLELKLPDPFDQDNRQECNGNGPICDPDRVLNAGEKQQLAKTLSKTANTPCKACLAVGIIREIRGNKDDLLRLSQHLQNSWKPSYDCKSLNILIVNIPSFYALLMLAENTPSCKGVEKAYNVGLTAFKSGNFTLGINRLAESFLESMKKSQDCEKDMCGGVDLMFMFMTLVRGKSLKLASFFIGGKVLTFVKGSLNKTLSLKETLPKETKENVQEGTTGKKRTGAGHGRKVNQTKNENKNLKLIPSKSIPKESKGEVQEGKTGKQRTRAGNGGKQNKTKHENKNLKPIPPKNITKETKEKVQERKTGKNRTRTENSGIQNKTKNGDTNLDLIIRVVVGVLGSLQILALITLCLGCIFCRDKIINDLPGPGSRAPELKARFGGGSEMNGRKAGGGQVSKEEDNKDDGTGTDQLDWNRARGTVRAGRGGSRRGGEQSTSQPDSPQNRVDQNGNRG